MRCQASCIADLEIEDTQFNSWTMNSLRWNMATGKDISKFPIQKKTRFAQYFTKRFLMLDLMSWNLVIFFRDCNLDEFCQEFTYSTLQIPPMVCYKKGQSLGNLLVKAKANYDNFSFQLSNYWPSDCFIYNLCYFVLTSLALYNQYIQSNILIQKSFLMMPCFAQFSSSPVKISILRSPKFLFIALFTANWVYL